MATWRELEGIVRSKVRKGHVTTYSQLANLLYPGYKATQARVVGMLVKTWEKQQPRNNLAHRIVAADGSCLRGPRQRELLEKEGVPFEAGRVALSECLVRLGRQRV